MGIYQGSKLMSGGGSPSPYEIAKQNGYTGTEDEFNTLLAALDQNATKEEVEEAIGQIPVVDAYTKEETYSKEEIDSSLNGITAESLGAATTEEVNELKTSVSEGKTLVAAAVTDKGVETAADATFATMATNIGSIASLDSLWNLVASGNFYGGVPQNGGGLYIYYPTSKVPTSFDIIVMSANQWNGYKDILSVQWCTIPNRGSSGSSTATLYTRSNEARKTGYSDGTNGTLYKGTQYSEEVSFSYNYTTYSAYVKIYIGGLDSISTSGSPYGHFAYVIPKYS